jgi:hypothetical protein
MKPDDNRRADSRAAVVVSASSPDMDGHRYLSRFLAAFPGTARAIADQEIKHMNHRTFTFLFSDGLLAVMTACGQSPGTVENKTESTTKTSDGTTTTTTESKEVGTTLVASTETKADTPSGTVKSKTETIVGTVTIFTAGKKIEVMTGEKKSHTFSLDDKDVIYSVDTNVEVGKRVTVLDETGDDKVRRITVRLDA